MSQPHDPVMIAQMKGGAGFIAALDQSGGSTPHALEEYGVARDAWSSDDAMFELIHEMRVRIITAPSFTGRKVLAAILFERTMDGQANGLPVPTALWRRGVVPLLKVDQGLEPESDGVQLMKPISGLDALLDRAVGLGVAGTKMRSVVKSASPTGIAAIVRQQFEVASCIIDHGLLPILEPEVSLTSPDRAQSESILRDEILKGLGELDGDRQVMLKLTIPVEPDFYAPLIGHHRVARVVALSGGYSRAEANAALVRNRGLIASFSRALLADLRHQMSDDEFDRALGKAIHEIYAASTTKA